MERCSVCRKPVTLQDRTVLGAFGSPIGVAHRACTVMVQGGVATLGSALLTAGLHAFKTRKPELYKAFDGFRCALLAARARQMPSQSSPQPGAH